MNGFNLELGEAMRLMRAGDLTAATQAIQRGLAGGAQAVPATGTSRASDFPAHSRAAQPIEGEWRVEQASAGAGAAATPGRGANARTGGGANATPGGGEASTSGVGASPGTGAPATSDAGAKQATDAPRRPDADTAAGFSNRTFAFGADTLQYKLFIPSGETTAPRPLLLMLHGCTQSPDDFARGTRMNALAQQHGYVIAYPAQLQGKNANKCWNWFRPEDQQRGRGEPALLAALTQHLVTTLGLDARRVFAAGMSAGGAMATVLAGTYPDLFAAIGVHSGVPLGIANDVPSAFAAMKPMAAMPARAAKPLPQSVPVIVFHGDRDATVAAQNGTAVTAQCLGTPETGATRPAMTVEGGTARSRRYTRTVYRSNDGRIAAEQWIVHGAGHTWSGGDAAGSHTDANGPDASAEMLRFFSAQR